MTTAIVAVVLAGLAVGASLLIRTVRPQSAPTQVGATPNSLRREDFVGTGTDHLIVVFSSATCLACENVWNVIAGYETADVAVQNVEYDTERELHARYDISSVPTTVVADSAGIAQAGFVGPLSPADEQQIRSLLYEAKSGGT